MPKEPITFDDNKVRYTLQGTQPYVLSGQWPDYFVPAGTEMIVDNSMKNIIGFNVQEQEKYAIYPSKYI